MISIAILRLASSNLAPGRDRLNLAQYTLTREELLWRAGDVLGWVASGQLKLRIERTYKLSDAAQAHRDLAGRATSGKLLLLPG